MTLREAIEFTGGTAEVDPKTGIRVLTGGDIGVQYFPIYHEDYRATLTGKIVDHFWMREIGFETIDLFKMRMRIHLNNIMPYFNQLYLSTQIEFDPLRTMDIKSVATGETLQNVSAEGEATANNATGAESRTVNSSMPQNMLGGNKDYATAAVDGISTTTGDSTSLETNTSDSKTDDKRDSQVTGYQGSPSDLINQYRAQLINVDAMILAELEPMFMQIWDTSDAYFRTNGWTI